MFVFVQSLKKLIQVSKLTTSWAARFLCFAVFATAPLALMADPMTQLAQEIAICTDHGISFEKRKQLLERMGYHDVSGGNDMWVQAQILHMGLHEAGTKSEFITEYQDYINANENGELFYETGPFREYQNSDQTVVMSISNFDDDAACSIAFSAGHPVTAPNLKADKVTKSIAGKFYNYTGNDGLDVTFSKPSKKWNKWLDRPLLTSGFLVVSKVENE
jgi:hypothetical protein